MNFSTTSTFSLLSQLVGNQAGFLSEFIWYSMLAFSFVNCWPDAFLLYAKCRQLKAEHWGNGSVTVKEAG